MLRLCAHNMTFYIFGICGGPGMNTLLILRDDYFRGAEMWNQEKEEASYEREFPCGRSSSLYNK